MNHYNFSDVYIGLKEEFSVQLSQEYLDKFCDITGDINPFHRDDEFAKVQGYQGHVAYGLLTASFLSTLAGVYLPGEKSLIQTVETDFVCPVYPNDKLKICGEVKELNDTVQQMILKVTIYNQDEEKVLRGKMRIGFLK